MDDRLQVLKRIAHSEGTAEAWRNYASALERSQQSVNKDASSHYFLELSPDHAQAVLDATDLFSRIHTGQLRRLAEEFYFVPQEFTDYCGEPNAHAAREVLSGAVKRFLFPNLIGGHELGISHHATSIRAKRAFDIHQALRHRIAWDRTAASKEKTMTGVHHYVPSKTGDGQVPRVIGVGACPCEKWDCPHSEKSYNKR